VRTGGADADLEKLEEAGVHGGYFSELAGQLVSGLAGQRVSDTVVGSVGDLVDAILAKIPASRVHQATECFSSVVVLLFMGSMLI
jgi:hypothetical protein